MLRDCVITLYTRVVVGPDNDNIQQTTIKVK